MNRNSFVMIRQSQLGTRVDFFANSYAIPTRSTLNMVVVTQIQFPNFFQIRQSLLVLLYTAFGSMFSNHFSSDSDFPPSRYRPRRNSIDYYTYNHHTGSKLHYHLFVVQICFSLSLIYV